MRRKTTLCLVQATNRRDCTQEDVYIAKKGNPQKRNSVSLNSSPKQRHKTNLR